MKNRLLKLVTILALMASGVSSANWQDHSVQDSRSISLNGDWKFADAKEKKAGKWNQLPVPQNWNTFTEYADYVGDGWYERQVTVPRGWKKQRIYLKFDAVYDIADVWLDGHYLGQHVGGYTPFEFDITEHVKPGSSYTLTVKANNEHVVGAWYQWGGISRGVQLFARDDVRLIRQKIEPVLELVTGTASVKLMVTVVNNGTDTSEFDIAGDIREVPDTAFRFDGTLQAGEEQTLTKTIMLSAAQVRRWHFDDPQLYHLKTTLSEQGKQLDALNDRFGIRSVIIKADGLYLNGEKVRLMGYNRVHDHRAYGNTEPRHLIRADIDMMKRSGANFSRLMHAPLSPDLLNYCDEVGYLIWSEIPMWQTVYRMPMNTAEDVAKAPGGYPGNAMREMMQRDWNHPSIIGWSPGNELRGEASEYVKVMRPLVKSIDPTRFYANIHDQGFQANAKGGFKGLEVQSVDTLFVNRYVSDKAKLNSVFSQHESIPNLPIFMSEFGETRSESLNHTHDFTALWQRLGKEPYVIGGAHWTFNDYRSYWHKANPVSQNRDWGIVDVWRNPKTFYYQMAKLNQPVNAIRVELSGKGGTLVIQPRGKLEIPSFTLRGYSLAYELLDSGGRVLEGALLALDDVAPDSPAIRRPIKWAAADAKTLLVSLISKVGYTVAEARFDAVTGDVFPLPTFPEEKNPDVRKVLPLDRSFMLGVTSKNGDTGIEVRYGTSSGQYAENLAAPVMGAIRVRGLENGKPYYGQVRRLMASAPGPWSAEFEVTPDGGLAPAAPVIMGAIKGAGSIALRLEADEKTWGYKVTLKSGQVVRIDFANPGLLIVPLDSSQISAVGDGGISDPVALVVQ